MVKNNTRTSSNYPEKKMDWQEAVGKVSRVIDDTCKEYDEKGHPYYSKYLREAFIE